MEIWEDIIGFEGRYQVSNLGRIKSLKRKTRNGRNVPEIIKKTFVSKRGYECVNFDKGKTYSVHRLIALSFIPNPNNLPYVNHIDGNKTNNSLDNLEWVTPKENTNHSRDKLGRGLKITKDKIEEFYQICSDWDLEQFVILLMNNCK